MIQFRAKFEDSCSSMRPTTDNSSEARDPTLERGFQRARYKNVYAGEARQCTCGESSAVVFKVSYEY